jgi:hypothetical protein
VTAPLTQFHPEIREPRGKMPNELSCTELANSVPQIIFANLSVASAMLNAFFAYAANRLSYQEVQLDILDARMQPQLPIVPNRLNTVTP